MAGVWGQMAGEGGSRARAEDSQSGRMAEQGGRKGETAPRHPALGGASELVGAAQGSGPRAALSTA